jgi:hypothetical protein
MDNIFADSVQVKVVGVGHEDTLQEFRFPPFLITGIAWLF